MLGCKNCGDKFNTELSYIKHLRISHSNSSSFGCAETGCTRRYKSIDSLRRHIRYAHCSLEKKRNVMKKSYTDQRDERNVAMEIANDLEICEKSFIQNEVQIELPLIAPEINKQTEQNNELVGLPNSNKSNEINPIIYAAEMYKYNDVPRNKSQKIINTTNNFIDNLLMKIQSEIVDSINKNEDSKSIVVNIQSIFRNNSSPFGHLNTEHKCFNAFLEKKTYIEPHSYILGERRDYVKKTDDQSMRMISVTAQFIPLRKVFTCFFELPNILRETLNYMNCLLNDSSIISNFIQGELWRKISAHNNNKYLFPLFIYFDDYENNNVLGSHRGISKCGAVYVSIPCLPPRFQAKLENIFLFILFNSLDRKYFSNKIIFSKVKAELNFLEKEGIIIHLGTESITIYFKLALVIGDNLGVHAMLGFTESFNQSKFCRFCYTEKSKINDIIDENKVFLRTVEQYEEDILKNDSTITGIVEKCVFTGIGAFHPIANLAVDVVHDALEGFCRYDLGLILHNFIKKKKYFSLSELNDRVKAFNYGAIKNKPSEIMKKHLNEKHIIMSAAEMLTLIRCLSLIIGHIIPQSDNTWELFKRMRDVIEICLSFDIDSGTAEVLRIRVRHYLTFLQQLFPGCFKPKHHFLIHYWRVMVMCGPLWKISTMRYEGKHREGKVTSHTAISRVNVCKTIAVKNQLILNYRFLRNEVSDCIEYNKKTVKNIGISYLSGIYDVMNEMPIEMRDMSSIVSTVLELNYEGIQIRNKSIIMIPSEDEPLFYEVAHIVIMDHDFVIISKQFSNVLFNDHTQAYHVKDSGYSWKVLNKSDVNGCTITHKARIPVGENCIIKNWL